MNRFYEKVEEILKEFRPYILNESAQSKETVLTFVQGGMTYTRKTSLFFTTSPHLFMAVQVGEDFKYRLTQLKEFTPEMIAEEVCSFAKTLPFSERDQLNYAYSECEILYDIIKNEFVELEEEKETVYIDGTPYTTVITTDPFLLLVMEEDIRDIFYNRKEGNL